MYTNLQQFEEEKVKSNFLGYITDQLSITDGERLETFLRTAIRQAGELTVQEFNVEPDSDDPDSPDWSRGYNELASSINETAQSWLSNEQPQ